MESFIALCISLASCYIFFAVICIFQLGRIVELEQGIIHFNIYAWLWPITVQQQVHQIVFLLSSVRAAFFIIAMFAWDSHDGMIKSYKVEFYSLDEFATVLFFTLASVLSLFWAELYYISTDNPATFASIVKPVVYVVNAVAFIAAAIITGVVSTTYSDVDYIYMNYTILAATVYLFAAVLFAYFAGAVASDFMEIPIKLPARRKRINAVRLIAMITIMALVVKAVILISITGRAIRTDSFAAILGVFCYYLSVDLFPLSVILLYYRVERVMELDNEDCKSLYDISMDGDRSWAPFCSESELDGLLDTSPKFKTTPSSRSSRGTPSPIRSMPSYTKEQAAPEELVNQIIARISLSCIPERARKDEQLDGLAGSIGQGFALSLGTS